MRSFNTLLKGVCLICSLFFVSAAFAQPANDNVANAEAIVVDGAGAFTAALGATAETDENLIVPPNSTGCDAHTWCDPDGITASVWYTFTAPASGIVLIDGCGSSYDNQIAAYRATDPTDFSTFELLDAGDDTPDSGTPGVQCGPPADPDDPMEVYGLSSSFQLECLTPNETIYVVVDIWSSDGVGAPTDQDFISLVITEEGTQGIVAGITGTESVAAGCEGGDTGSAAITFDGNYPIDILWDNGATTSSIGGLVAGSYSVTITDACGGSASATIDVADGPAPSNIIIDEALSSAYGPSLCGDGSMDLGSISVAVSSGTYPFMYTWDDGATTANRDSLPAGSYTVTVNDLCGNPEAVQTFNLGFTAGGGCANEGQDLVLGSAANFSVGSVDVYSENPGEPLDGNVACSAGGLETDNGYLDVVDLANDAGLSGEVKIDFIRVAAFEAVFGADFNGQFPLEVKLWTTDNADLSMATPTLVRTVDLSYAENGTDVATDENNVVLTIPFGDIIDVDATPLIVVDVYNPDHEEDLGIATNINFRWAGWERSDAVDSDTYIYSNACGLTFPGSTMTQIGFPTQELWYEIGFADPAPQAPTYTWSTGDGILSATDVANPTATGPGTYSVTVTDPNCGGDFTDQVTIDPCFISIVEAAEATFMIAPNPSSGLFNMINEGQNREFTLEVFDIQGKLMTSDWVEMNSGAVRVIDLNNQ
ncbi:MAG: hypothetical protein AAFV80_09550, partial [Bacteroidota bacterium]